ncbi:MAG: hypothetical protein V1867_01895 [Candidatus Falkowbacteria bacterium]
MKKAHEQLFFDFVELCTCLKEGECDCQNPPPEDWDGKNGVWHVSAFCPIHNLYPDPDPDCPIHGRRL